MNDAVLRAPTTLVVVSAALATLYAVAALFFLRFRARTGDRLFAWFATAFLLLSAQRFALILAREWGEGTLWLYGLRLVAFVLILLAIVEKNRGGARAR
jgi:Family of unknown function (DUF5985)